MTAATSMLDAALWWAKQGVPVFPLRRRGKRPLAGLEWKDEATLDPEKITAWWTEHPNLNIGAAVGAPAGVWVLDVDDEEGFAQHDRLIELHGSLPETRVVRTGGGGLHYWFRMPAGLELGNRTRLFKATILPPPPKRKGKKPKDRGGLDVRGTGGYVVLPPSVHPDTSERYQLEGRFPVADAPDWLVELVVASNPWRREHCPWSSGASPQRPATTNGVVASMWGSGPQGSQGDRDRARVLGMVREAVRSIAGAVEGTRNTTVNEKCYAIGGFLDGVGLSLDEVAPDLEDAAEAADQPRSMVRRALEDGRAQPRQLPPDDPSGPRIQARASSSSAAGDLSADVRTALQAVLDEADRNTRKAALADLHNSPHLAKFHEHEDLLGRLVPGKAADRLRSASKKAAKAIAHAAAERARAERAAEVAAALRGQRGQDQVRELGGGEGDDIRTALGAPDDWPTYPIPLGWQVDETGSILRVVEDSRTGEPRALTVALHPWYLLRTLQNFDAETFYVELGWYNRTGWKRGVFPRSQLRSTAKIVELADHGVDVRSTGNKNAVDWAFQCEPRLPSVDVVTTRLGWHGDAYVAGPEGQVELVDHHNDFRHWRPKGTWEGWLEGLRRLPEAPVIGLMLAAAASAPLLRFLDLDHNPLVDLSGPAGRGKTTALRVAGSGWGMPSERPGGTLRTWSSTLVGLERQAAAQHDVPFLVDDTARAERPETVRDAIYALVQGRGKMRGARDQGTNGGRLETATWRLTTLSTGEGPLVDRTEAGGARARPLSIATTPACPSLELAQVLEGAVADHYGHLGSRLAALAAERGDALKEAHRECLKWWAEGSGDTRMLSTAAAIEVAAELLVELGVPIGEGWRDELAKAVGYSRKAADQGARALDVIREELSRNPDRYLRRRCDHGIAVECGPNVPRCTHRVRDDWHGVWELTTGGEPCVGIYDQVLRRVLSEAGHHDLGPIEARWRKDGVVMFGTHGRFAKTRVGGKREFVIAFRRSALDL